MSVKSLKTLSFLFLCKTISDFSHQLPYLPAETVQYVVADIRKYLTGSYNLIRKWLLLEFCKQRTREDNLALNLWFFLDCVLDDSFTDMEFILSTLSLLIRSKQLLEREHAFDMKLLAVVSLCCPSIAQLKLVNILEIDSPELERHFITCVTSLKHLTKLDLNCTMGKSSANLFFTQLGDACCRLTHLYLGRYIPFKTDQQLNLVLGSRAVLFPQSVRDEICKIENLSIYFLQFDEEITTQICKSLKYVEAEKGLPSGFNPIFLLRHITQLEQIEFGNNNIISYHLLKIWAKLRPKGEVTYRHQSEEGNLRLQWTTNAPLPRKNSAVATLFIIDDQSLILYSFFCLYRHNKSEIIGPNPETARIYFIAVPPFRAR